MFRDECAGQGSVRCSESRERPDRWCRGALAAALAALLTTALVIGLTDRQSGQRQLATLAGLLDANQPRVPGQPGGRWKNLRRRSDFVGSWIFTEPLSRLGDADLQDGVDEPCWDPVILVPDANPTPPPTHRHYRWWQDPCTGEIGKYLVMVLSAESRIVRAAESRSSPHAAAAATNDPEIGPEPASPTPWPLSLTQNR